MNYRILLLSAYDAMSHKMWREGLAAMLPEHEWTQLVLPPRHFNWRIRGNSLQWALNEREVLERDYDLLVATSMVDLASLRGFLPNIARIPTLLYFHENQFVYPSGSAQRSGNIEPQLVPLYSTLCADAIVFNSNYNRSTFLEGARELLEKLPDRISPGLLERLETSSVIPVPLETFETQTEATSENGKVKILEVIWNHRWEYDKGPKLLLRVAELILEKRLALRLHVVGQQFRSSPSEFAKIEELLQQHADDLDIDRGCFGFVEDRADYRDLLMRSDIVLSTALHDFQGLAIQEACALGCTPLAPDALVYPEYIPSQCLYHFEDSNKDEANAAAIVQRLQDWIQLRTENRPLPKISLDEFSQEALRSQYAELLDKLATKKKL